MPKGDGMKHDRSDRKQGRPGQETRTGLITRVHTILHSHKSIFMYQVYILFNILFGQKMSVFKSAMGYFSSSGANGGSDNDFVGQFVEIGNMKLRVKKVIAEEYALKRLMAADEQANKNIIQEISILKKLSGHPNVIKYIAASFIDKTKTSHGMSEYLLLTDLCSGGSLMEALQHKGQAFPLPTIVRVFYQTCKAVQHMHAQVPPIAHRDLKLENFLISNEGTIKLCDFGSATTEVYTPNPSWSANQRNMLEENLAQFTTPMYRAPEMLDTWDNRKIDHAVDIWALGCILYTLCYMQHPFEDSAKLAILNGNYSLNPNDQRYKCFHEIINGCLCVNPDERLTISGVLERLAAVAETNSVNLKQPLKFERKKVEQSVATSSPAVKDSGPIIQDVSSPRPPEPSRPPPPARPPAAPHYATHAPPTTGGLFSSIKDGAGSFLKNLKDTSSKVMQTVQQPDPILPHFRPVSLVSITIQPVPLFTKARLISPPLRSYESLHLYNMAEGKVTLPLDCTVTGDVVVCVHHARQQLGRLQRVPMLSVSFHCGFLSYDQHAIKFTRRISPVNDHFSSNVSVIISLVVQNGERRKPRSDIWEEDHSFPVRSPDLLFSSTLERDETIDNFVTADYPRESPKRPDRPSRPAPPTPQKAVPKDPQPTDSADLLNISSKKLEEQESKRDKLKSEDSFDFFGLMEKTDDNFGEFLVGKVEDNAQPFTENIFSELPAPPTNISQSNVNSSDPLNFDPFGLNEPLPKQEPLLAPHPVKDEEFKYIFAHRSHFDATKNQPEEKTKNPMDVFGDLLGSQGYEFAKRDTGPKTMNAMRKEEMVREMDPEKLKIHEWTEGKKANIRALLCSLHNVVWPDCRWSRCDMSQLVSPADVKRNYRKACLAVHPDK
ncbi:unnamed protein product, partial [Leptidea sinapis]